MMAMTAFLISLPKMTFAPRRAEFCKLGEPLNRSKAVGTNQSLFLCRKSSKGSTCTYPRSSTRFTRQPVKCSTTEPLVLTEENVTIALDEVKQKLGSMFGNSVENREVGITGDVHLASLDGPTVVLNISGRFWHKRADVVSFYGL